MTNHRVQHTRDYYRIAQISGHLTPFGQCPRDYSGGCGGEGELKEPKCQIFDTDQEEVGGADE
jgi:hypothetical protein